MALMVMLFVPLSFFMTACGATPSNEVRGVFFQSDKYDQSTGYAIFEVDLNVPTTLSYKVNPSTWSGYKVTYNFEDDSSNHEFYNVENGVITVIDEKFSDTRVKIHINGMTDTCIVTLKRYPDRFYLETKSVNLSSSGLYSIRPVGEYDNPDGTVTTVHLTEADFNFSLISNDESKVQLIDKNRLDVYAVSKTGGDTAMVTVQLLDTSGKVKNYPKKFDGDVDSPMVDYISFTIVPSVAYARLSVDGSSGFIENGGSLTVTKATLSADLKFKLYLYSEDISGNRYLIKVPFEVELVADLKALVNLSESKDTIQIHLESSESNQNIEITLVTNTFDSSGIPFAFRFSIQYNYIPS